MKLFPFQQKTLDDTAQRNRVGYFLDMGLGKTFVGSEKMFRIGNKVNLLICQRYKIDDWIDHLSKYYDLEVYNLRNKKEMTLFLDSSAFKIGVINYELAWRRRVLLTLDGFTLMLDESSLIQNPKAKQSAFIMKLRESSLILLSGTPTDGKYENLWTQASKLGWNITQDLFNRQYINWVKIDIGNGMMRKVVDKINPYRNVERLKNKFREHGAVFMKTEEVMDLPEQVFTLVKVEKTKEYNFFRKHKTITLAELGIQLIGDTLLTERLYSRMLAGHLNQNRLDAFEGLVASTNDRLIVFYTFNDELAAMKEIANKLERPISELNGHVKDLDAYENESDSITFVQYKAGSMGFNFQKSNKIIYFTLPEKSEYFEQSKKRIHRIGQDQTCFYWLMVCRGTVDDEILRNLKVRKDWTDELFTEDNAG